MGLIPKEDCTIVKKKVFITKWKVKFCKIKLFEQISESDIFALKKE